jgi:hypothetical protein
MPSLEPGTIEKVAAAPATMGTRLRRHVFEVIAGDDSGIEVYLKPKARPSNEGILVREASSPLRARLS